MKVTIKAMVGMVAGLALTAVFLSQHKPGAPVWNTCQPLEMEPEKGQTLALSSAQYRVVRAKPLTVEYNGLSSDEAAKIRGTVVVTGLRCEP